MGRTGNRSESLRVVRVPGKGRGVVTNRPIPCGEVLDTAPVVVVPARDWALLQQTVLSAYCFIWDDATGSVAFALGPSSLFNHSYDPNVACEKNVRSRRIVFEALRDIATGEELTINYNGDIDCRDPVGFDVTEP